jgi:hypothetical protein
MQFLKNHWMSLASAVVGLAAIAGLVLGMTQKSVTEELKKRVSAAQEIESLKSGAQNEDTINAEKERGQKFDEQYKTTLDKAASINKREPLLEGVFPKPAQPELAYRFQEVYKDKLYELPRALLAGGLPTPQDVEDELEIMQEEAARKLEREGGDETGGSGSKGAVPPPEPPGAGRPAGPMMPPPGGSATPSSGTPTASTPMQADAQRRAAIRKAHNIRIYADANPARSSFQISPIWQSESAPSAREMWYAQVSYWVQQDVVDAIRKLNDDAAQQIKDGDINVGVMPVKRIVNVRVFGYISGKGELVRFDALGAGSSTLEMKPAFTGRKSDAQFDVVRFAVTVVMDQRELLKFADRMTRQNFYQVVDVDYGVLNPTSEEEKSYYYGPAPVVRATFDFEGFMARKVYLALMPEDVQKDLGVAAAAPAADPKAGKRKP